MITTSGRDRAAVSMASAIVAASPTMESPDCRSISVRSPSRTSSWSSQSITRRRACKVGHIRVSGGRMPQKKRRAPTSTGRIPLRRTRRAGSPGRSVAAPAARAHSPAPPGSAERARRSSGLAPPRATSPCGRPPTRLLPALRGGLRRVGARGLRGPLCERLRRAASARGGALGVAARA
jgi:hypothetical protein